MKFDLNDQQGMARLCRILANFAGDTSAPWCVSREWRFDSIDETAIVMYPLKRVKAKHPGRLLGTTAALIEAGYGGGTPETVHMIDYTYPDGKDGVAIALAPELPDGTVERFQQWLEEHGLDREPGF